MGDFLGGCFHLTNLLLAMRPDELALKVLEHVDEGCNLFLGTLLYFLYFVVPMSEGTLQRVLAVQLGKRWGLRGLFGLASFLFLLLLFNDDGVQLGELLQDSILEVPVSLAHLLYFLKLAVQQLPD
jgi:hypothetical protein